jgi:hypothetical protein
VGAGELSAATKCCVAWALQRTSSAARGCVTSRSLVLVSVRRSMFAAVGREPQRPTAASPASLHLLRLPPPAQICSLPDQDLVGQAIRYGPDRGTDWRAQLTDWLVDQPGGPSTDPARCTLSMQGPVRQLHQRDPARAVERARRPPYTVSDPKPPRCALVALVAAYAYLLVVWEVRPHVSHHGDQDA